MPLLIDTNDNPFVINDLDVDALKAAGLIVADDLITVQGVSVYRIAPKLLDDWPELTGGEVLILARHLPLLYKRGRLTDTEALDLINYVLSAPEFSASFLEDIVEIVRRTPRSEIRGATWASH